jgi:hypothetical protein
MTLPSAIFSRNDVNLSETIRYRCESTELPGRTIATIDDQSTGTTKKFGYDVTYNDITMNLIASEDMNERYLIEKWIDNIVRPSSHNSNSGSGGLLKYYDDYAKGTVVIRQLDNDGDTTVAQYTLHEAYPIQLSAMNLNWAEFDTYQRFSVTMTYRYYTTSFPTTDYIFAF